MIPAGGRRSKIRPPRKSLISSSSSIENSTTDPTIDFDKNWSILENAISQIQNKNVSNLSYEQLYRKAYVLVLRKFGGRLYDNVGNAIKEHLLKQRSKLLISSSHEQFMQILIREWDEHLQSMKFISDVLMYLNRVYVKEQKKLLIYDLGVQLFKDYIIMYNNNEIGSKTTEIILEEITKSRNGIVITSNMYITKIIQMMEMLVENNQSLDVQYGENYYQSIFEPVFLKNSENFFQMLSKSYVALNSGSKYLHATSQFIKDEENRIKFYLPSSTHPKLSSLMDNILIKDKIDKMILLPNEGLKYWLEPVLTNLLRDGIIESNHYTELKLLYRLIGRIDDEFQLLRIRLKEAIIAQGLLLPELVKNALDVGTEKKGSNQTSFATKWIEAVLKYREEMLQIWTNSFDLNPIIEQTLMFAMRDFINNYNKRTSGQNNAINAPEILSIYMDYHIKQLNKGTSGKELTSSGDSAENLINNSIQFLRFVKDKDAFEAHFANHFAKRFLNSKNSSYGSMKGVDIEDMVLSKLCEEMGTSSLDKVIKMNKDIKTSKDTTREWMNNSNKTPNSMELDLKICNVSMWPKSLTKDYKNTEVNDEQQSFKWPRQLRETIREFEEFWFSGKKNDNKSLHWSPKFGSIDMRITYPSKTYDINLSVYAAIIMLLFAPGSSLEGEVKSAFAEKIQYSYKDIAELTGIPTQELKRHLQSIAVAPKSRLLVKIPMTKDVNEDDIFKLNEKFKSPSVKVKVLTVSISSSSSSGSSSNKKSNGELDEVNSHISEGRKIEINAAIVRIMKSRRTVKHNELIEGIVKQLSNRFQPSMVLMKQRIEDLIDKEYLERDSDDRNLYHYIT
ncbi:uncharacterized protein KGF55_002359 [Candida pseudojiufengensis]|uniref:uncharacterized protein n=1 Tax=Candida pseudojiufengensis TaxID=497109 RepID=UPI0022251935|nr:uncharacterized protein KGF55_002359 [Candida pseudojiufengensis]KAI5963479.1 hypothetical protein KGF55_002359 [Candida pseudojiufengensis]